MRAVALSAFLLASAGAAQATVPALPCTSDPAMVSALKSAIDKGNLGLAEAFLSDDIIYGDGSGFRGKRQVISAFATGEWEGPSSRLVFATWDTLFFQRPTRGIHDQLVAFDCRRQDFAAKVVAVRMHRRNDWIEMVAQPPATAASERDKN